MSRWQIRVNAGADGAVVLYDGRMVDRTYETEAKWRADEREHERLRMLMRQAGGSCTGTVHEVNTLFDSPDDALRLRGQVLRLRWVDRQHSILTLKGPATFRRGVKTREEIEVHLTHRDAMIAILNGLGFRASLEYWKARESWDLDGATVALDTLEFGRFVEIEGTEASVRLTAERLGLDLATAERQGYPGMMREYLAAQHAS